MFKRFRGHTYSTLQRGLVFIQKRLSRCMTWRRYPTKAKEGRQKGRQKGQKAVTTRWLSLHASVDGMYAAYAGLLETLNILEGE